ncbi:hypothetical protein T484DRAFT_1922449 [Baffinella frigidus]|nr:hypothetical protein T484DRAFT_1922449 [Cryptophyta sp. CCMP2293]
MTSSKWLPGTLLASALLIVAGCVLLGTTGNSASSLLQERLEMSPAAMRHLAAAAKKAGAAPPRGVRKPLEKIATLLAKEQLYSEFNGPKRGRAAGFSEWKHVISDPRMESIVEHDVKHV